MQLVGCITYCTISKTVCENNLFLKFYATFPLCTEVIIQSNSPIYIYPKQNYKCVWKIEQYMWCARFTIQNSTVCDATNKLIGQNVAWIEYKTRVVLEPQVSPVLYTVLISIEDMYRRFSVEIHCSACVLHSTKNNK